MKIISGNLSGRSIKSPKGRATRPTSARAKESLFNFLAHGLKFNFDQTNVLDLFAGSGSLGIESLSRGAKFCSFIDKDMNSIITIKDNLRHLGLEKQTFIKKCDATKINFKFKKPLDLIFSDPPYKNFSQTKIAIERINKKKLINDKGIIVTELSSRDETENIEGFIIIDKKIIGDTQFCIYSLN
jgi:16S rRNA (guanine966-N2)-methyltransferase